MTLSASRKGTGIGASLKETSKRSRAWFKVTVIKALESILRLSANVLKRKPYTAYRLWTSKGFRSDP